MHKRLRKKHVLIKKIPKAVRVAARQLSSQGPPPDWFLYCQKSKSQVPLIEPNPPKLGLDMTQAASAMYSLHGAQGELSGWMEMHSLPLLDPYSGQVEGRIECTRDVTEKKLRQCETEAIAALNTALRPAITRSEMCPIILEQVLRLVNVEASALALVSLEDPCELIVLSSGSHWKETNGLQCIITAEKGTHLLVPQEAYRLEPASAALLPLPTTNLSVAGAPLMTEPHAEQLGGLWVARHEPIGFVEMHILKAVSGLAANALQRAGLYEQVRQDAKRMTAVSRAIHGLVKQNTAGEIYALLGRAVMDLLPEVMAVIIGIYDEDGPVHWVYAVYEDETVPLDAVPDLLQLLAGSSTQPIAVEPAGIYSGGQPKPQPAIYAPLATPQKITGELQAYRRDNRPFSVSDQEVLTILTNTAAVAVRKAELYDGLQRSNDEIVHAYDVTLESLARALELRDRETEGHTRRVADLTVRLAARLGLDGEALTELRRGAQLHDIGKMGVPDGILLKTHPLTKEEWVVMRRHTEYALDVLHPIDYLKSALDIPHYHHEKWDGSGYPDGLKGEEIPLAARIFAIVDVWDALTSDRPYRAAWTRKRVLQYMRGQSGKHFDPRLLAVFLELIAEEPGEAVEVDALEFR
jgi:HD-GYP domain-containing protein (c-di-GMP phosphodiesterase class II)